MTRKIITLIAVVVLGIIAVFALMYSSILKKVTTLQNSPKLGSTATPTAPNSAIPVVHYVETIDGKELMQTVLDKVKAEMIAYQDITTYIHSFTDTNYVEIPKSIHNKSQILHVQVYDNENEFIYPPLRVTDDLTVIVEMFGSYSGKIKIF